jgi:hypothetical protein
MISELLRKWFGLENPACETCEVLRAQLDESNRERKELLHKLIDAPKAEPVTEKEEELVPIKPQFTPWRVRQQLLEAEDRKKKQLLDESIKNLESELQVK